MTQVTTEKKLRRVIAETIQLLESVGETYWSSRMRDAHSEPLDLNLVLSWFGGMGSFNDLVIAAVNGHKVHCGNEMTENQRLDELRERMYSFAQQVKMQ